MQRGKQLWRDNVSFMLSPGCVILSAALSCNVEGWLIKSFILILATWINDVYIMRHKEYNCVQLCTNMSTASLGVQMLQIWKVRAYGPINLYSLQDLDKRCRCSVPVEDQSLTSSSYQAAWPSIMCIYIYNYLFQLRALKQSSSAFSGTELTMPSAPGAVDKAASANQAWQELLKL